MLPNSLGRARAREKSGAPGLSRWSPEATVDRRGRSVLTNQPLPSNCGGAAASLRTSLGRTSRLASRRLLGRRFLRRPLSRSALGTTLGCPGSLSRGFLRCCHPVAPRSGHPFHRTQRAHKGCPKKGRLQFANSTNIKIEPILPVFRQGEL